MIYVREWIRSDSSARSGGCNFANAGREWQAEGEPELQRFADKHGIAVRVSHFLPGTSKWNKV